MRRAPGAIRSSSASFGRRTGAIRVPLESDSLARFVMLDVPGHDLRFSDNFFDLPAGRSVTVSVEHSAGLRVEDIAEKLQVVSLRDSY